MKESPSMERAQLSPNLMFPPGFRFHPSDEELIVHYLQKKVSSHPLPASIIAEVDLYKYNPWELPKKALFGKDEWYFFSPRDRKYPNGARPNRAAASGFWKATGIDKPILTSCRSKNIGVKKALVFYSGRGRHPKGIKTDWVMNEYRLTDTTSKSTKLKGSMRLDDWVLCRVRQKGYASKKPCDDQDSHPSRELATYPPNIERHHRNTNYHVDMINDYLYKDYQLIASILAGQPLPTIGNMTSLSFKGSKGNNFTSAHEDDFNKMNSQITLTSLDSYFDPEQVILTEENHYGNVFSINKKIKIEDNNDDLLPSKVVGNNIANWYNQNQSQDAICDIHSSDPIINFQGPDELALAARYLQ
ncbi:NAC domain-containing protein [Quillaja saponaria]|uniref:NAC domain-containing protein n=1 Tax=Quillaja saponaria TaxID=32244 RepID=A0AAD7QGB8_QUISA|nr:NAC domain-containing protein [Quillaja saponaria]